MKKAISLILSFAILMTLAVCPVFAASEGTMQSGTVSGIQYYYTDSYFENPASEYNASLSTMSFCLAMAGSASSSNNWAYQYKNLYKLFEELQFTNPEVNEDFTKYPGLDTMGAGCAYKITEINGKTVTLLAIVPRSVNYEGEWGNNFTLGTDGDAEGFSGSADKVVEFANYYAEKYGSNFEGELKVWVVGYSRGAAVANLTAGRITTAGKIGSYSVDKENIYGYTFETPSGLSEDTMSASEARSYTNIHNIVSANDVVTKVAGSVFGFMRYGTDESVIPDTRNASNDALFECALTYLPDYLSAYTAEGKKIFATETFTAKQFTGDITVLSSLGSWTEEDGIYKWKAVDSETAKSLLIVDSNKTQAEVLDDLVTVLFKAVATRENYVNSLEGSLRLLISELAGGSLQTKSWETAKTTLKSQLEEYKESIIIAALTGKESYLEDILTGIAQNVLTASGLDLESYADIPVNIAALAPILARAIAADVALDGGSDILSLIENMDIIFNPHYPDQCISWLMAQDPNYTGSLKSVDAAVKNVNVEITKETVTKKVLFIKVKTTKYNVSINPVSDAAVGKIEYRTTLIGSLTAGRTFTKDIKPGYIYIKITDANGNVTVWEYKNGSTTQK